MSLVTVYSDCPVRPLHSFPHSACMRGCRGGAFDPVIRPATREPTFAPGPLLASGVWYSKFPPDWTIYDFQSDRDQPATPLFFFAFEVFSKLKSSLVSPSFLVAGRSFSVKVYRTGTVVFWFFGFFFWQFQPCGPDEGPCRDDSKSVWIRRFGSPPYADKCN